VGRIEEFQAFNNMNRDTREELRLVSSNEKRDSWYNEKEENLKLYADSSLSHIGTKIDNLDSKIDDLLDYLEDYSKRER
jgi:hypothetical protein